MLFFRLMAAPIYIGFEIVAAVLTFTFLTMLGLLCAVTGSCRGFGYAFTWHTTVLNFQDCFHWIWYGR